MAVHEEAVNNADVPDEPMSRMVPIVLISGAERRSLQRSHSLLHKMPPPEKKAARERSLTTHTPFNF